jgi:nucleotide-binding universal stress UspA family protein
VPHRGTFPRVGGRVLVAWNGAREGARAVEDAMPILEQAREVTVLTVDLRSGEALSVDHLVRLLERHGVNASAQGARSSGRPTGEVLLSTAMQLGCDLLVMGGYGHSPLREHLFGGVTYWVVEHMTLPVLLSH